MIKFTRFFQKNSSSIEYYFFAQAIILLSKDTNGIIKYISILLAIILFLAGLLTFTFPSILIEGQGHINSKDLLALIFYLLMPLIIGLSIILVAFGGS